jgi:hypothetical protein
MIIRRVTELVDARVLALKQDLTEHFGVRHDELTRRMTEMEDLLAKATENFDRWAMAIRKDTGITKILATSAFANSGSSPAGPETPQPGDPRPMEIDHAVAADPSEGAQRVDLPECGAVVFPRPGTDASTAWAATGAAIRAGRLQ